MSPISQRLSVEELIVVLYQTGMNERADDLINNHFGSIPREEIAVRLVTASNSLMARNLLMPEVVINKLDESLEKIGEIIGHADYTIHCNRNSLWNVTEVFYHFYQGLILENKIVLKVVHEMTELMDVDAIVKSQIEFIKMDEAEQFDCPSAYIPNLALSEFQDIKDNIPIEKRLIDIELSGAIPETTRNLFSEDWMNSQYWCLFMRYEKGTPPLFERGFMIMRGEKRFWLMRPVPKMGEYVMEVMPAVQATFEKGLRDLCT